MEKKIKFNFKKIFAIFTLIVLLQNYCLIFGNIAIAIENEIFDLEVSGNSDFIEMTQEQEENIETADTTGEKEENEKPEDTTSEESEEPKEEQQEEQQEVSDSAKEEVEEVVEEEEKLEDEDKEETEESALPEEVISSTISSENASIYKGYFYANIVSEQKYETVYNYTETIEIKNAEFVDEIYVEEEGDKFVFDTGVELKIGENTYYKQTLISEEELKKVVGQEGYIEIYSKDGELVGRIDSNTEIIDGKYVFNYDLETSEIIVKIVNPENNGILNIKQIKAIKSELEYSRKQIELFRNIQTTKKAKAVYGEEKVWELENSQNLINLEETESRMALELNTNEFSTMLENQVTFNVTLKTNEERYDLFKDPTVEILMPSAVENLEITSINLLYKNGLSLSNWEVITNEAGKKVIKVALEGNQTEYMPGSMQEGTTLVIYTKIEVNKLTSNTQEKIKMRYTNKNSSKLHYEIEGKESEEVDIEFVSKEGIIKSNSLLNFNESLEGIYGFNDEFLIGSLDVDGTKKAATVNMAVVNNYSKELEKVSILGRIPTQGVKDANGNELGTTIDTILLNAINYSGVSAKIYYSPKIDAPVEDESWTDQVVDFGLIKSYKIELENPMKQGDRAEFGYSILIPENLKYNETLFSTYQVNYYIDNQLITEISSIGAETEKREIVLEDCKDKVEHENLSIGMSVTKGGKEVEQDEEIFERQILRYTAVLKNTTSKTLNNVKIKGKAANSNLYYFKIVEAESYGEKLKCRFPVEDDGSKEYEEIVIEQLKPNEELKLEYQVIVKEIDEEKEEYVWGEVYVSSDELVETKIETAKNKIKQAKVSLKVELGSTETVDGSDLAAGYTIKYWISIKNISDKVLENVDLGVFLPEVLEYDPESLLIGEDDLIRYNTKVGDKTKATIEIPKLEVGETKNLFMLMTVKEMDISILDQKVSVVANTFIGEEEYISNDYIKTAHQTKTKIEYEYVSNIKDGSEVKSGDEVEYVLNLKNTGSLEAKINIWGSIDNGIKIEKIILKSQEGEEEKKNNGYISLTPKIKSNEELTLIVKGKIEKDKYLKEQEYIENYFEIYGSEIEEITTNVISFKITDNEKKVVMDEVDEKDLNNFYTEEELKQFEESEKEEIEEESDEEIVDEESKNNIPNEEEKENEETENDEEILKEENDKQEDTKDDNIKQNDNKEENNNNANLGTTTEEIEEEKKGKYTIKGTVWNDVNKNGKQDSEEKNLKNIIVNLYKSNDGISVVYNSNNLAKQIKTDSNGNYEFKELEEGYYLVMIEYDSEIYNLTEYKSEYAGESSNSDFITKTITTNGNKKIVAISDIIKINSDISSINLGLIYKDETDIEIKKYISSITIEDDEEKETIDYEKEKITKLEIAAKKLGKTEATIIYEFEMKNNGDLDTYVTNLVDYLPKGLEFDEKLNTGWYKGEDGNLYNLSLVNTKIEAGKSKKLKLALSVDISDDTLGSYINKTEVIETTNDKKLVETNLENNKSEVELLITIKTGEKILFYGTIIMILIVLIILIYLIKTKKIKFFNKF